MASRLSILLGFVTGVFAAIAILAGVALMVPNASAPSHEPPSVPALTPSPSIVPSASLAPSSSPSATPPTSAPPSSSAFPAASASPASSGTSSSVASVTSLALSIAADPMP